MCSVPLERPSGKVVEQVEGEHIQVVWDRARACTAQAGSGVTIDIGTSGGWTPEQLLVAATESSLMTVFLRLADEAGLAVLGYVSAAEATLDREREIPPSLVVRPCIVVGREQDKAPALRLIARTLEASPAARALKGVLRVDADVIVVEPADNGL